MTYRVGHIPYLNMAPFHEGFGPAPVETNGIRFEFSSASPRLLGQVAAAGRLDAGCLSLVDGLELVDFEPLGDLGLGARREAQSVLVFSRAPLAEIQGVCAVTDETSTSVRLLEMLLAERYGNASVSFGRIASPLMFDGDAAALLLIGDDALRAKAEGVKGFPTVTDLGREWLDWHETPFAFARWMVRKNTPSQVKHELKKELEKSLESVKTTKQYLDHKAYFEGFSYRLGASYERSIERFAAWWKSHV